MQLATAQRISRISLPDPLWRYVILFQSWPQFLSWCTGMGLTMSLFALLVWLGGGDTRLIPQCVAWGMFGGAWSLLFASKTQFSIEGATAGEKASLEEALKGMRYRELEASTPGKRFGQDLPRLLRWSASDVTLVERDGAVVCTGPQTVIRPLRRRLLSAG